MYNKIGNLSKEETKKKLAKLGLSDLSLRSESHNFVISFNVVESLFEPAIEFFVLGFKPKFSENELSYAKEFVPIPVDPEISNPEEILSDKLYQNLYPNHVYGKNTTGSSEAIAATDTLNQALGKLEYKVDDYHPSGYVWEKVAEKLVEKYNL